MSGKSLKIHRNFNLINSNKLHFLVIRCNLCNAVFTTALLLSADRVTSYCDCRTQTRVLERCERFEGLHWIIKTNVIHRYWGLDEQKEKSVSAASGYKTFCTGRKKNCKPKDTTMWLIRSACMVLLKSTSTETNQFAHFIYIIYIYISKVDPIKATVELLSFL